MAGRAALYLLLAFQFGLVLICAGEEASILYTGSVIGLQGNSTEGNVSSISKTTELTNTSITMNNSTPAGTSLNDTSRAQPQNNTTQYGKQVTSSVPMQNDSNRTNQLIGTISSQGKNVSLGDNNTHNYTNTAKPMNVTSAGTSLGNVTRTQQNVTQHNITLGTQQNVSNSTTHYNGPNIQPSSTPQINNTAVIQVNNRTALINDPVTRNFINKTSVTYKNLLRGPPPSRNRTKISNLNPTMWLLAVKAPWEHVSGSNSSNTTEVMQACRFDGISATCSGAYTSWDAKLWFRIVQSEGKRGIDVTVFEKMNSTRVVFKNIMNGTSCQIFRNGTFHQVCVKVYGYDKDLGPTRVCIEIGVAIFNHGVASSDFGCFRFGKAVIHEDPLQGESPHPRILKGFILSNNYSNIFTYTPSGSQSLVTSICFLLIAFISVLYFK